MDKESVGRGKGSFAMRMGAASIEAKWSWCGTCVPARILTSTHMMLGSPAWIPLHTICWSAPIGQREALRGRQVQRPKGTPWSCRQRPSGRLETAPSVGWGRRQKPRKVLPPAMKISPSRPSQISVENVPEARR